MNIGADIVGLLLRLLEAPELQYDHRTMAYHGAVGEALIGSDLLVPSGFARSIVAVDEDDAPLMEVDMNSDRRELGYHSPMRGWVKVEQRQLQRYRPDLPKIFGVLLGDELRPTPRGPMELEAGLLWELGTMRLTKRGPVTDIWFARRLGEPMVEGRVRAVIDRRPSEQVRLIITTIPHQRLRAGNLPMTKIIPIGDVLSSSADRIDLAILKARFAGTAAPVSVPLHLSDDNRRLTIHGKTIGFHGKIIRTMLRIMVDAHCRNERLRAEHILQKAGSSSTSLDQAFGERWVELSPYLKAESGTWAFDL